MLKDHHFAKFLKRFGCLERKIGEICYIFNIKFIDMKLAIGSDHAGFSYKQPVVDFLISQGHEITDFVFRVVMANTIQSSFSIKLSNTGYSALHGQKQGKH